MYDVVLSNHFKKDLKLAKKRGYDIDLMKNVVDLLSNGEPIPAKYHDYDLTGSYRGFRECHILPDWLLIYKIEDNNLMLFLSRTGSHSDLF